MSIATPRGYLHMGARPVPVTLKPLGVSVRREVFELRHAIARGIRWATPGTPPPEMLELLVPERPLPPWAVVALLAFAGRKKQLAAGRAEVLLGSIRRDLDAESAVAALEKEATLRGLRGGALVRRIDSPAIGLGPAPSVDVALCLLVLAKSAERVFVAAKRPALERLRPGLVLELLQPLTGWTAGGVQ